MSSAGRTPIDLPTWLGDRLTRPLPPEQIRAQLAPALSYGRHFGPPAHDARMAAVTILLYPRDGQWHVPFTVRPETMLSHAGQISFPGGMVEPGESSRDAALRELAEELGVATSAVETLGVLSPLYVFVSNIMVTPWVGVARRPLVFRPCDREVAAVLETPVGHWLDATQRGIHEHRRGELAFQAPHFAWGDHKIWGATSIILAELVGVLDEIPAQDLAGMLRIETGS